MEQIAVLIPCFNEARTIGKVIEDFKRELPEAVIFVYDNNSTDQTAEIARGHGAVVRSEPLQGKGNVIRSMFRDIKADIYVMIDGDDTYPAETVRQLIRPVREREADMVIGDRLSNGSYKDENKRFFHNFGNQLVKRLINRFFHAELRDIMSGYRVFSRHFVKHIPINSGGFEIETEMTLHALDKKIPIREIPIDYRDRPEGSYSKLNTFSDGFRVLKTILWVFKDYRPLAFFSATALLFFMLALLTGLPVVVEFIKTAYITKLPSAILAVGLMLIAIMSLFIGFVLDTIVKQHRENFELLLKRDDG